MHAFKIDLASSRYAHSFELAIRTHRSHSFFGGFVSSLAVLTATHGGQELFYYEALQYPSVGMLSLLAGLLVSVSLEIFHRGSQFTSSLWSEIAARLGVKLHHTSAYHPQANGMIERFHQTLKTALKTSLLGRRTTLGISRAQNYTQRRLKVEHPALCTSSGLPSLSAAKHIYGRRNGTKGPLQRPYSGPYAVLTPGDKTFLIDIGSCAERISVDRTKPAFFNPFQPAILSKPPPRGRPPAKQSHPSRSHPSDSNTASKHQQAMSGPAHQISILFL
ncbi:hypothetical protein RRG08_010840 [Elysia crispata]|uniref:Integrase catalytic domain-containing protein n=1 Tax=Elysia crispata TaxID=231223 RepID=A0AAE0XST8_9GAST|nr:hypothetical protein RRG08_010840 [Elysia crispata]